MSTDSTIKGLRSNTITTLAATRADLVKKVAEADEKLAQLRADLAWVDALARVAGEDLTPLPEILPNA